LKIFFFTTVFAPSVGGIERVAEVLATQFVRLGHEVVLATLTPGDEVDRLPFSVIRKPSIGRFVKALRWADIHIQANVSLKYCLARLLKPGRFLYRHGNVYQADDGSVSNLDRLKRVVARRTTGIANSRYTAAKLACAHTIFNPYDDDVFFPTVPTSDRPGDLVFLGRLVSQKGCDVLVRALGLLGARGIRPRLVLIGDGPERAPLAGLAADCGVAAQVDFIGRRTGQALAQELNRHRIIVVPSRYEEPFGVVALEGLACGCLPVVAERGGLVDAVGPHGLTFPNGDHVALAARIEQALGDPDLHDRLMAGVADHLDGFRAETVARRYLDVFRSVIER
jgi:glycosyltransferase involved in cell wall biosynthesis